MIWLITGSRNAPKQEVRSIIGKALQDIGRPTRVLHGAAEGADTYAAEMLREHNIHCLGMPALWRPKDKSAGVRRNAELLNDALDLATIRHERLIVIAMPGPQSKGTHDMLARVRNTMITYEDCPEIHIHIQEVSK